MVTMKRLYHGLPASSSPHRPVDSHPHPPLSSLRNGSFGDRENAFSYTIENKLHGALAVTFNADRCRLRKEHAPENVVALRHIALNLLRQESSHHISLR
jgi:hypothetical protein